MVTKVPPDPMTVVDEVRQVVAEHAPDVPVLAARLEPTAVRRPEGAAGPEVLNGARVFAVAGLGRPEAFADLLRAAGAEVVETRWFADHHGFTETDVEALVAEAITLDAVMVTTAKDAVKMPPDASVWVVEAAMVPVAGGWDQLWRLLPGVVS